MHPERPVSAPRARAYDGSAPTDDTVVFLGPTLSRDEASKLLPQAHLCPPAERGDVLQVARAGARVIALVDGYFEHRLAVQHKEILWALSHGIRVFGASSMGALRAAELARYGMEGVGQIYEWIVSGEIEDDDEVAVTHTPEPEYRSTSVALVNLRATLRCAVEQDLLDHTVCGELCRLARLLFYPLRTHPALLAAAEENGLCLCEEFKRWWAKDEHHVDQKRLDARSLCYRLQTEARQPQRVPSPGWQVPWTGSFHATWNAARRALG